MKKLIPIFAATFLAFFALVLCFGTVLGYVQDLIHFSGIGSEIVFMTFTFTLSVLIVAWMVNERQEIAKDRQFRAETAFNSQKFKSNLAGTSYSYMQDIEAQADRWEEQERLKQYFNS